MLEKSRSDHTKTKETCVFVGRTRDTVTIGGFQFTRNSGIRGSEGDRSEPTAEYINRNIAPSIYIHIYIFLMVETIFSTRLLKPTPNFTKPPCRNQSSWDHVTPQTIRNPSPPTQNNQEYIPLNPLTNQAQSKTIYYTF